MQLSVLGLFSRLVWIDGAPLLDRIEPYRQRLFVRFFDEPRAQHPLDRSVQRARPHARGALGEALDLLHDGVAVSILIGERQQDVRDRRGQGQEVSRTRSSGHISVTDIA